MNFYTFVTLLLSFLALSMAMPQYFEQDHAPRDKREHGEGITGPVHTFVKTDKNANYKWGVRHHVGHHYAGK